MKILSTNMEMTSQNLAKNKDAKHSRYCKIFPTTSKTDLPGCRIISDLVRSRSKKTETKCTISWFRTDSTSLTGQKHGKEEKIPVGHKNMQLWKAEEQEVPHKWSAGEWRIENNYWESRWKWFKLRSLFLIMLLLTVHWPTAVLTARSKNNYNGYCEPNNVPLLIASRVTSSAMAALFARSCRCAPDWRSHFCSEVPRYKSLLAVPEKHRDEENQLPTVCICRQFTPENSCRQFMTQCFFASGKKRNECMCCFNQPGAYCNQLQCQNGEPVFGVHANTTCICYTPTFYPYSICTQQSVVLYDEEEAAVPTNTDGEMSHYIRYPIHGSSMKQQVPSTMAVFGLEITPAVAITIVLGLLGAVVLLTTALLVVRTCRTHREHRSRATKRELAQTVLLEQRAEEEKYLP